MIVCQCKGTTDATVRRVIRAGASSVGEIGSACLAGTDCGGCHETLVQILRSGCQEAHRDSEVTRASVLPG